MAGKHYGSTLINSKEVLISVYILPAVWEWEIFDKQCLIKMGRYEQLKNL